MNGYPLARTQGELTPFQREFLLIALPEINRLMYASSPSTGLTGKTPDSNTLNHNSDVEALNRKVAERRSKKG